eukprot:Rhum_TRINITY_DN11848_c0_g1::Rhum_TRINITY_DN11848_c0_g1_i1::g.47374::m.47374
MQRQRGKGKRGVHKHLISFGVLSLGRKKTQGLGVEGKGVWRATVKHKVSVCAGEKRERDRNGKEAGISFFRLLPPPPPPCPVVRCGSAGRRCREGRVRGAHRFRHRWQEDSVVQRQCGKQPQQRQLAVVLVRHTTVTVTVTVTAAARAPGRLVAPALARILQEQRRKHALLNVPQTPLRRASVVTLLLPAAASAAGHVVAAHARSGRTFACAATTTATATHIREEIRQIIVDKLAVRRSIRSVGVAFADAASFAVAAADACFPERLTHPCRTRHLHPQRTALFAFLAGPVRRHRRRRQQPVSQIPQRKQHLPISVRVHRPSP